PACGMPPSLRVEPASACAPTRRGTATSRRALRCRPLGSTARGVEAMPSRPVLLSTDRRVRWRSAGAITLGVLLVASLNLPVQAATPTGQRLRTLATAANVLIGYASVDNFDTMADSAPYRQTAIEEFNILTPENRLKFDATEPQQNTFTFASADTHINFALANNMVAHGHTLVWHQQLPGWVTGRSWTAPELTAVLNTHIDTVVGHYVGKISVWDVVNEAFNDDGSLRQSLWQTTIGQTGPGSGYIEQAFRRARAADQNAVLVYNDFNIEPTNVKSD